jgi:hypothetical protein
MAHVENGGDAVGEIDLHVLGGVGVDMHIGQARGQVGGAVAIDDGCAR